MCVFRKINDSGSGGDRQSAKKMFRDISGRSHPSLPLSSFFCLAFFCYCFCVLSIAAWKLNSYIWIACDATRFIHERTCPLLMG
ncbi:hypothetical protein CEXT_661291 [Caerostris extrusa]|uniref:Uncharacterized protein n=1 Tax=Caerostris extrusa TaxID=172846 RepID=A0AAV4W5V9_CAEEX|nr:hypothetical protein CEXT_661291 [Caerostris extrusa]